MPLYGCETLAHLWIERIAAAVEHFTRRAVILPMIADFAEMPEREQSAYREGAEPSFDPMGCPLRARRTAARHHSPFRRTHRCPFVGGNDAPPLGRLMPQVMFEVDDADGVCSSGTRVTP